MKKTLVLVLILATFPAFAKKLPGDDARKEFVLEFMKLMERDGRAAIPMMEGKSHDVLQIALPQASVPFMYEFEQGYIEPMKLDPYRSKLLKLGFRTIELKSDYFSASFPNGTWVIPIAKP